MELEEGIFHLKEKINGMEGDSPCKTEHLQLLEWLCELWSWRYCRACSEEVSCNVKAGSVPCTK